MANENQFTVSSMTLEADGDKGFDVLVDDVLYGPVKRILYDCGLRIYGLMNCSIEPSMMAGSKTQLHMNVMSFFPFEF